MRRILVVEDSEVDRQLIGGVLAKSPELEVEFASDGARALARLETVAYDLIVTDLVLPEMDGLALVGELRENHPSIPVVLVTAKGSEELAVQALRRGAASYVPKKLLAMHLQPTVEDLLAATEARQERNRTLRNTLVAMETRFELENDRRLFGPLIAYLQETLTGLEAWDDTELLQLGVALEEALVNAAEHGNLELDSALRADDSGAYWRLAAERRNQSPYSDRRVRFQVSLSRQEAIFVIGDEGQGFDPGNLPDPTDPRNLLRPSGRGVLLMRTFMDDVRYNARGNQVTLIKKVPQHTTPPGR